MKIKNIKLIPHQLNFKFEAGTSRGTLKHKAVWYIVLYSDTNLTGIGEVSPLPNLSTDAIDEIPEELKRIEKKLLNYTISTSAEEIYDQARAVSNIEKFPSIIFALETAMLDLLNGGSRLIFETDFYRNEKQIPINGLIWMGDRQFMENQIEQKLKEGFDCIKMKIGAIDFDSELKLLKSIRKRYSAAQITLRVDANGAFSLDEAMSKLEALSKLEIHSIEQPIKAGQIDAMQKLSKQTPIPIALDEELIGINTLKEKQQLLEQIDPHYIIIKPSLIGGIKSTLEWVKLAESKKIGWWMTSMLESNIGLNAISQLASYLSVDMPQGLGTGQLYTNNLESPLIIQNGTIFYDQNREWNLSILE